MSLQIEGTFPAKIHDYGILETKAGDPKVWIDFIVTDYDKKSQRIRWSGGFYTPQGIEMTMKTLVLCGLSSSGNVPLMGQGLESRALDVNSAIDLVIELRPSYRDPSKMESEIKYVNRAGVKTEPALMASKLAALNLASAFQKASTLVNGERLRSDPLASGQWTDPVNVPF